MTADAYGVGAFELAACMAALARDVDMSAIQVESGAEVVEWLLRPCGRGSENAEDHYNRPR